jgi:hypothetical protein
VVGQPRAAEHTRGRAPPRQPGRRTGSEACAASARAASSSPVSRRPNFRTRRRTGACCLRPRVGQRRRDPPGGQRG